MKFVQLVDVAALPEHQCPDNGLLAIERLGYPSVYYVLGWIVVCISFEQAVHVVRMLWQNASQLSFVLRKRPVVFPIGLAYLWVFFTAVSHILVVLTNRSTAALLTKTLHVVTETTFLIQISAQFGYDLFASIVAVIAFIVAVFVFSFPCQVTVTAAAYSGIILDGLNFFSYLLFARSERTNNELWLAVFAFQLHLLYLVTFAIVENEKAGLSDDGMASLRIAGAFFNYFAGEVFLYIGHSKFYSEKTGWVNTLDWMQEHTTVAIWNDGGVRVSHTGDGEVEANIFAPYTTGYETLSVSMLNTLFPIFGSSTLVSTKQSTFIASISVLCTNANTRLATLNQGPESVFVFSWAMIRSVYMTLSILIAIILAFA